MRQCPDVALSSPCVPAVGSSPLPHSQPDVLIRRLDPDVPLPAYAHPGDAGADLVAREDAVLEPGGGRALVPTGIALALPAGSPGLGQPRRGVGPRHAVPPLHTPRRPYPG